MVTFCPITFGLLYGLLHEAVFSIAETARYFSIRLVLWLKGRSTRLELSLWLVMTEPGGNWNWKPYRAFVKRNQPLANAVGVGVAGTVVGVGVLVGVDVGP